MGLLKKLEQSAAKQLQRLFLDATKYADGAISDLEKAEKALADAKLKAVEATQRQHEVAVEAANKAKEVADQLALEAKAAEERAAYYENIVKQDHAA